MRKTKKKGILALGALLVTAILTTGQAEPMSQVDTMTYQGKTSYTAEVLQSTRATKSDRLVKYASKHIGKPYRYGAAGPSSFDCSGFTQYVYKNSLGISVPRSSKDQAKTGKFRTSNINNLYRGDLLVFKDSSDRVQHVGIYIGNGYMIHASSSQGIIKTNVRKSSYWKPRFDHARRIY